MMDQLHKRVADRMAVEARQLRAEQVKLMKRRQALAKVADRAISDMQKLFAAHTEGKKPTKAVQTHAGESFKAVPRAAREMEAVNAKLAANAQHLARLEDHGEVERRVKQAQELGVTDKPVTGVEAAELVLIRRGRATHITDLTSDVLESGLVKLSGRTPSQTMSAYLAKEAAKPNGRFVRVAPGVFDLKSRANGESEAKEPQPEAA